MHAGFDAEDWLARQVVRVGRDGMLSGGGPSERAR
jgi:hypothetical protein